MSTLKNIVVAGVAATALLAAAASPADARNRGRALAAAGIGAAAGLALGAFAANAYPGGYYAGYGYAPAYTYGYAPAYTSFYGAPAYATFSSRAWSGYPYSDGPYDRTCHPDIPNACY